MKAVESDKCERKDDPDRGKFDEKIKEKWKNYGFGTAICRKNTKIF
jgi:hypothetical protein